MYEVVSEREELNRPSRWSISLIMIKSEVLTFFEESRGIHARDFSHIEGGRSHWIGGAVCGHKHGQ